MNLKPLTDTSIKDLMPHRSDKEYEEILRTYQWYDADSDSVHMYSTDYAKKQGYLVEAKIPKTLNEIWNDLVDILVDNDVVLRVTPNGRVMLRDTDTGHTLDWYEGIRRDDRVKAQDM